MSLVDHVLSFFVNRLLVKLVVVHNRIAALEPSNVGECKLGNYIIFDLSDLFGLHALELNKETLTSFWRLMYSFCVQLLFLSIFHFFLYCAFLSSRSRAHPLSRFFSIIRNSGSRFALFKMSANIWPELNISTGTLKTLCEFYSESDKEPTLESSTFDLDLRETSSSFFLGYTLFFVDFFLFG